MAACPRWLGLLALVASAGACGGGDDERPQAVAYPQPNPTPPSELPPTVPPVVPSGVTHTVRMVQTVDGRYAFDPLVLRIRPGDRVQWVAESGIPHNVAFYPESIPPGAAPLLQAIIPEQHRISALGGRILVEPGQVFGVTFAGVPTGRYGYYCIPHEVMGMRGTIVIEP